MAKNKKSINWKKKKVLVTGGASFIGSHLVDALLQKGAKVRVVDNLSSGVKGNLASHLKKKSLEFIKGNLLNTATAKRAVKGMDIVFHLACAHGGRGFVDLYQAESATNLSLDGNVFLAAYNAGCEKIIYASSGCVYPNFIQENPRKKLYLTEDLVKPPHDADNMYGWSKLMGELTLKAFHDDWGIKTVPCRFFTVYGERGKENHAVIAMIARAFINQDPFIVWGDGNQIRNWTHVSDIVRGMLLAAERIDDSTPINLGTTERIRVIDAVKEILSYAKLSPRIKFRPDMPTGPYNRVADNSLAKKLLGWQPQVKFFDGLHKTIDWYFATKDKDQVKKELDNLLTGR